MKKIYTLIAAIVLFAGAYAQTGHPVNFKSGSMHPVGVNAINHRSPQNSQSLGTAIVVDYDSADKWNQLTNVGNSYSGYIWDFNAHYTGVDSSLKYGVVAFDSLIDTYNTVPTGLNYSAYSSIIIDSIEVDCSQENNSGINDTLVCQIVGVTAAGYPTNTILASDTVIFDAANSLSLQVCGTNEWVGCGVRLHFFTASGFTLPTGTKKFAVQVMYLGNKQDTFGIIAGFPSPGTCSAWGGAPKATYSSCFGQTTTTHPYANTFTYWTDPRFNALEPTSTGSTIIYVCAAGDTGATFTQNLNIMAFLDVVTGIQENKELGIKLNQNIPNPFNGTSDISYQIAKRGNVTMNITDISGRNVMTINEGAKDAGTYKVTIDSKDLSQGVYFYTLNVDGYKLTNRMIVTK